MNFVLVFFGGGIGAVLRYILGISIGTMASGFPVATLLINAIGSFLIGFLAHILPASETGHNLKLLLIVGVLGGFTTFSAFSLETLSLLRAGAIEQAGLYVLSSVAVCLVAVALGFYLVKSFS